MREISKIVIHCSDSSYGDAELIRKWHLARGFVDIGYTYVILNGYPDEIDCKIPQTPDWCLDGAIETGRTEEKVGAHCKGHNKDSIGICLIGNRMFTLSQVVALCRLVREIRHRHGDGVKIVGHYELDGRKSCPNIDMDHLREKLALMTSGDFPIPVRGDMKLYSS